MSLANVAYNASFGWIDRTSSLESQMEVPMYNELPVEMGLKGHETEVLGRFSADADYTERFRAAFPASSSRSRSRTSSRPSPRSNGSCLGRFCIRSLSVQR
jgi:cytochrome c peroxidase